MKVDLQKFERSLAYASEMTGIYQTLLGWQSMLGIRRLKKGMRAIRGAGLRVVIPGMSPVLHINPGATWQETTFESTFRKGGAGSLALADHVV